MNQIVALRLRKLPVIHYVPLPDSMIDGGSEFLVRTQHGTELARLLRVMPESFQPQAPEEPFVREVLRPLHEDDRKKVADLKIREREAFAKSKAIVTEHKLKMKMLKAELLFDQSRIIFYYKSDTKVDFRDLLKSLATAFKTRIELRQIGVRDEAKLLGGIGCCGKEVCCAQFMVGFAQVSTKMAKDQNLSLNPTKLSGICNRLLCCLGHEYSYYASFHGKFPKIGADICVAGEKAKVFDLNYITQKILIGFFDRRKLVQKLEFIKGRKDPVTGKNLWWIQEPGQAEPDLSVLTIPHNQGQVGGKNQEKRKGPGPSPAPQASPQAVSPKVPRSPVAAPVPPEETDDEETPVSGETPGDTTQELPSNPPAETPVEDTGTPPEDPGEPSVPQQE